MKKLIITPNPNRKHSTIHKETREIVLKNFPEYNREDLYDFDHLSCGLLVRKEENEKYTLFLSTILHGGTELYYAVYSKQTKQVCLTITVQTFDGGEVHLDKDNPDNIIVINNKTTSDWTCANYMFFSPDIYSDKLVHSCEPYIKNVVSEDDEPLGYSTVYGNRLYISQWIGSSVEELKKDKWKSHKIYCELR